MNYNDAIKNVLNHQHNLVVSAAIATGKHKLNQLAALHEFLDHYNSPLTEFTSQTLAHQSAPVKHLADPLVPSEPPIPTVTGNLHHRLTDNKTVSFHIIKSPDGSDPLIHTVLNLRTNLAEPPLHLHATLPIADTLKFVAGYNTNLAKFLHKKITLHQAQSDFDSESI